MVHEEILGLVNKAGTDIVRYLVRENHNDVDRNICHGGDQKIVGSKQLHMCLSSPRQNIFRRLE